MTAIPTTRAAHLIEFVDLLRDIGTPVERELRRVRLPMFIEELPDALISTRLATDFLARCARLEKLDDLGWLGAKRFRVSQLNRDIVAAVQDAPTVYRRLARFIDLATTEDPYLCGRVQRNGGWTRVSCDEVSSLWGPELKYSEWLQIAALVEIVRSIAGPAWAPDEITFQSVFRASEEARHDFGNTRLVFGHPHTSIVMPTSLLAATGRSASAEHRWQGPAGYGVPVACPTASDGFVDTLRGLIRPYLNEMHPPVSLAAEIAGVSMRTLQRRLRQHGTSYSELVEATKFDVAADLLRKPGNSVIDVAMAVGYEDPSNFSRAFRRMSGMSPREYRLAQRVPVHLA